MIPDPSTGERADNLRPRREGQLGVWAPSRLCFSVFRRTRRTLIPGFTPPLTSPSPHRTVLARLGLFSSWPWIRRRPAATRDSATAAKVRAPAAQSCIDTARRRTLTRPAAGASSSPSCHATPKTTDAVQSGACDVVSLFRCSTHASASLFYTHCKTAAQKGTRHSLARCPLTPAFTLSSIRTQASNVAMGYLSEFDEMRTLLASKYHTCNRHGLKRTETNAAEAAARGLSIHWL